MRSLAARIGALVAVGLASTSAAVPVFAQTSAERTPVSRSIYVDPRTHFRWLYETLPEVTDEEVRLHPERFTADRGTNNAVNTMQKYGIAIDSGFRNGNKPDRQESIAISVVKVLATKDSAWSPYPYPRSSYAGAASPAFWDQAKVKREMNTLIDSVAPELAERGVTVAGAKSLMHSHANIDAAPQDHWAFLAMQEMRYNSILIGD